MRDPYKDLVDCDAVMDALEAKRAEPGLVALSAETPDYHLVLRGGKDLFARTGRHFDIVRAEASSSDAVEFALLHDLQKSFGMDVLLYDEPTCKIICAAWAARQQFLLDQYSGISNIMECF